MSWPGSPSWKSRLRAIAGTTDYACDLSIEVDGADATRYEAEWNAYARTSNGTIALVVVTDATKRKVFLTATHNTAATAYQLLMDDAKAVQALIVAQDVAAASANLDPAGGMLTYAASISFTVTIATP